MLVRQPALPALGSPLPPPPPNLHRCFCWVAPWGEQPLCPLGTAALPGGVDEPPQLALRACVPAHPQVTFYNDNEKRETTVAQYFAATGARARVCS